MRLTLTPQHRNRLLTCLILALNAALLTGGALAESRLPLGRTDDAHLKPPSYEGTPRPAVAPPRPAPHVPSRIVYAFEHPAKTRLVYSAELSRACRRGTFLQRLEFRYRAFGPGERPLGVAFGTRAINLVDPGRLREADIVYFFENQGAGPCRVYIGHAPDLKKWFVGP